MEKAKSLLFFDSLSKAKKPFAYPGKTVDWYMCGPTVYEDSHLGHARNYMTNDILRRIMLYYFKIPVRLVMNFTDVDDKIIKRARTDFLMERFAKKDAAEKIQIAEAAAADARSHSVPVPTEDLTEENLEYYKDVIALYLTETEGKSIDFKHEIFLRVTRHFETRFLEDMETLNVMEPDKIVRVSESMQQIVDFIVQIQEKGFAYETPDHSVYFDIKAFEEAGHQYARLEPNSRNNKVLQQEGEGALANNKVVKRSDGDFALWKASKPGEPSWPSPWGEGRPGWHIECSAMASTEFGDGMDIHSGGIDLAFPHHDNELAQSEAYWSKLDDNGRAIDQPWVRNFMHMGHLNIKGAKMSKSLKNFTTIRSALAGGDYTPRSLRIVFLSSSWRDTFEVSEGTIEWSQNLESTIDVLFVLAHNLRWQQDQSGSTENTPKSAENGKIEEALHKAESEVDAAFKDSFNTREALESIARLINTFNAVVQQSGSGPDPHLTFRLATWITEIVQTFGLVPGINQPDPSRLGWEGSEIPAADLPGVHEIAQIRQAIRVIANKVKAGEDPSELIKSQGLATKADPATVGSQWAAIINDIETSVSGLQSENAKFQAYLALADQIRDQTMWNAGYYLEDTQFPNLPFLMRPLKEADRLARSEADARAKAKEQAKLKKAQDDARKAAEEAEKAKVDPAVMFKTRTDEFSEWDQSGLPTKKADGEEVPKNQLKKLKKEQDAQRKLHEKFQKLSVS